MPKARKHVEVDATIGARLRERRRTLGLSQTTLAAQLGVTFQMIQRYEYGRCRISASTLFDLSVILGVPVSYFFEEIAAAPADEAGEALTLGLAQSRYGRTVAAWFPRIADLDVQRVIADLIQAAADNGTATILNLEA
jgi:transcriptional regulator with XRE-family HTH domain